jgi:hypothetical protein
LRVDGDGHGAALAPAHDLHRARDAVVRLLRDEERQRWPTVGAVAPDIEAGARLPCPEERGQVAGRAARGEDAIGGLAEAERTGHPAHELPLHGRTHRAHLVDRGAIVEERDHEIAQRGRGQGRRYLVSGIARVMQVVRVANQAAELLDEGLGRRRLGREFALPAAQHLVGGGPGQDGQLACLDLMEVLGQSIDQAMAQGAEGLGVEGRAQGITGRMFGVAGHAL